MRSAQADLPRPDPTLHKTGSEGLDGNRGLRELRLLEHFGLQPSSDLLDIGCGIGRLAYECASFLDSEATYTGIDIAPVAIDWLNANYAPHLPGFRFDLLNVGMASVPRASIENEATTFANAADSSGSRVSLMRKK